MRYLDADPTNSKRVGAEDAARGVALFIALIFGLALATLLLLGFVRALPTSIVLLIAVTIGVVTASAAWAIFRRSFSTPASYHTGPPVIKIRKQRRPRRPEESAEASRQAASS